MSAKPMAVLLTGPTCSGKSALALDIAARLGGAIINADSMQLYRELRIMTARPTPQDEARAPHALYGVQGAAEAASVAWWRQQALGAMQAAAARGQLPIVCGGTGLYFSALISGLAHIPDPGREARSEARALLADEGPQALHARLASHDPDTARQLRPTDAQRLARAWEVWRGTGAGLAAWQARHVPTAPEWRFAALRLDPPRDILRATIAARVSAMLAEGGLAEVDALLSLGLDPTLPAMRAHGVPELAAYRRGELTLPQAAERTRLVTGQYTKRQATWFRHHDMADAHFSRSFLSRYGQDVKVSESILADTVRIIRRRFDSTVSET